MFEQQPTLKLLFEQLGLEADDASIESFVKTHQKKKKKKLHFHALHGTALADGCVHR